MLQDIATYIFNLLQCKKRADYNTENPNKKPLLLAGTIDGLAHTFYIQSCNHYELHLLNLSLADNLALHISMRNMCTHKYTIHSTSALRIQRTQGNTIDESPISMWRYVWIWLDNHNKALNTSMKPKKKVKLILKLKCSKISESIN